MASLSTWSDSVTQIYFFCGPVTSYSLGVLYIGERSRRQNHLAQKERRQKCFLDTFAWEGHITLGFIFFRWNLSMEYATWTFLPCARWRQGRSWKIQFLVSRHIAIATSEIWEEALKLVDSKLSLYYLLTNTELSTHYVPICSFYFGIILTPLREISTR